MKIKFSFVTNSSSSSFIAFAIEKSELPELSKELILEAFDERLKINKVYFDNHPDSDWAKNCYEEMLACVTDEQKIEYMGDDDSLYSNIIPGFGCTLVGEYGGEKYFGIELREIMKLYPELKVGEMAKELAEMVNKKLGTNFKELSYIEECWYNG